MLKEEEEIKEIGGVNPVGNPKKSPKILKKNIKSPKILKKPHKISTNPKKTHKISKNPKKSHKIHYNPHISPIKSLKIPNPIRSWIDEYKYISRIFLSRRKFRLLYKSRYC